MLINLAEKTLNEVYHLMTQAVIPRPIAWVLTENEDLGYNLAPFSYFNVVSSNPPIVSLSISRKGNRVEKDTMLNISERRHFVVHIADASFVDLLNLTSANLERNQSEVKEFDIALCPQENWYLPRIDGVKVALQCEVNQVIEVGNVDLILGEVKEIYLADEIVHIDNGRIKLDAKAVNPLSRLGGSEYAVLGEILSKNRP